MKYKNPPVSKDIIFNELLIDWEEPIVLVEGIFDAVQAKNSIPLLGSTISVNSNLFNKIIEHSSTVYFALDKDAENKSFKIINMFVEHGIEVFKINIDGYEDVGQMSKNVFNERKINAEQMTQDFLLVHKICQIV